MLDSTTVGSTYCQCLWLSGKLVTLVLFCAFYNSQLDNEEGRILFCTYFIVYWMSHEWLYEFNQCRWRSRLWYTTVSIMPALFERFGTWFVIIQTAFRRQSHQPTTRVIYKPSVSSNQIGTSLPRVYNSTKRNNNKGAEFKFQSNFDTCLPP